MPENLKKLPLNELRQMWASAWSKEPHERIGRTMLEKSLEYKTFENEGHGLTSEQQTQLKQFIKQYKRNTDCFEEKSTLKPGTRLVRKHHGKKHSILVKVDGFEYQGLTYKSLSKIATVITGQKWNGWLFFGLKNAGKE